MFTLLCVHAYETQGVILEKSYIFQKNNRKEKRVKSLPKMYSSIFFFLGRLCLEHIRRLILGVFNDFG